MLRINDKVGILINLRISLSFECASTLLLWHYMICLATKVIRGVEFLLAKSLYNTTTWTTLKLLLLLFFIIIMGPNSKVAGHCFVS